MAIEVQVTVDCADPDGTARFWVQALGYEVEGPPEGYPTWEDYMQAIGLPKEEWDSGASIVDPDGRGPRIFFQRVPEGKVVKNRLHLDLGVGGGHQTPLEVRRERVDAEAARLAGIGAARLHANEEGGWYGVVMQDPEGNEFCLH
ncbi:MAG: glyoxalase [Actinobacteria bacterium 13_2_20CM_2_71_6]|nr:MAG: glyoxalase [Actinobacteria bacterium 13_2_20CM_2_71_6]